jgi:hypothetical protein
VSEGDKADLPVGLTAEALAGYLGASPAALRGISSTAIGTGQIADSFCLRLDWAAEEPDLPASVVAKCTSPDETSLASAKLLNLYTKEVNWYRELAPLSTVRVPVCHEAHVNEIGDDFLLLLEDCAPAEQGNQLAGIDVGQAESALVEAARLHAPFLGNRAVIELEWLQTDAETATMVRGLLGQFWPMFKERYHGRLPGDLFDLGDEYVDRVQAAGDEPEPPLVTVTHGDFRIDNMLFGSPDGRVVVLDWQTVAPGHPLSDVAYLLGTSIADSALRRAEEQRLVEFYCEQMAALGASVDRDQAWTAYRRYAGNGFAMAITASMLAKRTERGDEMFAVMAERPAQQMMDLDTLSLL